MGFHSAVGYKESFSDLSVVPALEQQGGDFPFSRGQREAGKKLLGINGRIGVSLSQVLQGYNKIKGTAQPEKGNNDSVGRRVPHFPETKDPAEGDQAEVAVHENYLTLSYSNNRIVCMTHGETILLRLLSRSDYYGYQLDKIIEDHHMRQWAGIGFSSIYNLLNKLEKKGLVTSHFEKEHGSPRRKVYSITLEGRGELKKEVIRMLKKPAETHDDFTVGVVVSDVLGEAEFAKSMAAHRKYLEQKLQALETRMPETVRQKERVMLAFDRVKHLLEAEIRWIDSLGKAQ